jgi:hypothetical protein
LICAVHRVSCKRAPTWACSYRIVIHGGLARLREKDSLDLGYGVQRRDRWPMYRRGWYQVMGGEVGFCGPVCATFRVSVLRFFVRLYEGSCFPHGRCATDWLVLSHMVSWDRRGQDATFFVRAGLWSDRNFPFLAVWQFCRSCDA